MSMSITPELLDEIKALAEAATRGPWQVKSQSFRYNVGRLEEGKELSIFTSWVHPQLKGFSLVVGKCNRATDDDAFQQGHYISDEDASHIARMDPATTLALVAHVREVERERDEREEECAKIRNVLGSNECYEPLHKMVENRLAALSRLTAEPASKGDEG